MLNARRRIPRLGALPRNVRRRLNDPLSLKEGITAFVDGFRAAMRLRKRLVMVGRREEVGLRVRDLRPRPSRARTTFSVVVRQVDSPVVTSAAGHKIPMLEDGANRPV